MRFFHPSDEAAAADWDAVAVEGARRAVRGQTQGALLAALRETFAPLAPTLLVFREIAPPPPAAPPGRGPVLAWQHEGFGFGELGPPYRSGRTGRPRSVAAEGAGWAPVSGSVDAALVRGKRVRLRGWARVDGADPRGRAQLWLRVDGKAPASEFFDNMQDRAIASTTWRAATIESPRIGAAASKVAFGGIASGGGAAFFDDFALEVAAPGATTWTALPISNPGFEAGSPDGWATSGAGYEYAVVPEGRAGGAALKIEQRRTVEREDVFEERPAPGESFERPLGAGLACRVVLGLPATAPPPPGPRRAHEVAPGAEDPAVRAAAVVIAWNVFRHFYPYHDVIGEDWDAVLDAAIADVLDDAGPKDLDLTLRRLVHRLHDGHGRVMGPTPRPGYLPIRLARVEGAHVVLAAPTGSGLRRGDEVVAIDGVPIAELHARRRGLHSGSPQFIDHQLLAWGAISEGEEGSTATVDLRRDGRPRRATATRTLTPPPTELDRPPIEKLAGGVFYVDLDRATDAELGARMAEIARAPGVVFDLRGYPKSSPDWLAHLMTRPDQARWMFVPRFIRPGGRAAAFTEHGWGMRPAQPHIAGKVAFVTGPGAISYAESVMGMVEGYRLAPIVGAPTAGANGNINPFSVPGGFRIIFTGMKVTRLDGRQHHLVGVQPTHPVDRTLAGIRAGRDEELEVALALVRPRTAGDRSKQGSSGGLPRRAQ